jgi:response regulator NasT
MPMTETRVLTAETDPAVRTDVRLTLEQAGFSVCAEAQDGLEAVDLARMHQPDVVLLDLGLPKIDGLEATRRIVAERDVPVVALAGGSAEVAALAVGAGAASFLRKPFASAQLLRAVQDALEGRGEQRIRALREESRTTLRQMCELLGYPPEFGDKLERRAYASGRIWRFTR